MILTTSSLPALRVIGIVVAAIPFVGNKFEEGVKDLRGRTHPDLPAVMEKRRYEVLRRLGDKAQAMGANAVIEVRFDNREITTSWKELCAYGTAVVITTQSYD